MENRRDDESRKEIIGIWIIEYLLTMYNIYIKYITKFQFVWFLMDQKKKKKFRFETFSVFIFEIYRNNFNRKKGRNNSFSIQNPFNRKNIRYKTRIIYSIYNTHPISLLFFITFPVLSVTKKKCLSSNADSILSQEQQTFKIDPISRLIIFILYTYT